MSCVVTSVKKPALIDLKDKTEGLSPRHRSSGTISALMNSLSAELTKNFARFHDLCRRCSVRQAATLALVKLMDYSDHLPMYLSPAPVVVSSDQSEWLAGLTDLYIQQVDRACSGMVDWEYDAGEIVEVSYNASLGEGEVHPHIVHAYRTRVGDRHVLCIRYFDDESTVWLGNPCRASTVTLSEILIDLEASRLQSFRYYRFRSPKRHRFDRGKTLEELHAFLDDPATFLKISRTLVTFGVSATNASCEVICRYGMRPTSILRRIVTCFLIQAQLSVVTAILKENVAFTRLAAGRHLALRKTNIIQVQSDRSNVIKDQYGRKQLRTRLRKPVGQLV